jgi:3-oxoacyl-[acyl-carrier protein] reductase
MQTRNGKVAMIAERLAPDGFDVVANYARSAAKAEAVVTGINARRGRASALQADIGSLADVRLKTL